MTDQLRHIISLLQRRLRGETLDANEVRVLEEWAAASEYTMEVSELLLNETQFELELRRRLRENYATDYQHICDAIGVWDQHTNKGTRTAHRVHFLKTAWFKYAAAIIVLFGIGAYLWNTQQNEKPLITETKPVPVKNDVVPGTTRAILTLSDGRKVELTPETGTIAESGINIQNANGRLEYAKAEKVVFNTMTTPRGGQYQLTLPDGTNVWLNAASSITYPTAFPTRTREVTVTGEAYFEVRKNPAQPFVVKTPSDEIAVLGTSFNVNAYADEAAIKTSLIEGSIQVGQNVLQPGQAFIDGKVIQTNVQQDVAWKNGVFDFNDLNGDEAMRQLARWYDIEIKYDGNIREVKFGGELDRSLNLSQVLRGLEGIGGLHFSLEGKTVTVVR